MGTPEEKDIDTTITSDKLKFHLDGCDAYTCVISSQNPSVHVYYALRAQIERSSMSWLQEFVSLGGLDGLLDALCQMTGLWLFFYLLCLTGWEKMELRELQLLKINGSDLFISYNLYFYLCM